MKYLKKIFDSVMRGFSSNIQTRWLVLACLFIISISCIPFPFNLFAFFAVVSISVLAGIMSAGCARWAIGLPAFLFIFLLWGYDAFPEFCLITIGLATWIIWGKLKKRRLLAPAGLTILAAFLGIILIGIWVMRMEATPYPVWSKRSFIKRQDYKAIEFIFGKSLPKSFRIASLHYPGIGWFPAPDGPAGIEYVAKIDAKDFESLRPGVAMNECEKYYQGDPYDLSHGLMRTFENPKTLKAFEISTSRQGDPFPFTSWLSIDAQTSPTLILYLYTKVPYYM